MADDQSDNFEKITLSSEEKIKLIPYIGASLLVGFICICLGVSIFQTEETLVRWIGPVAGFVGFGLAARGFVMTRAIFENNKT